MVKLLSDPVNSPEHYNHGKQEAITILENSLSKDQFQGYLKGNILKYLLRYDHISKEPKYQSLEKAEWYLKILIKKVKKNA